MCLPPALPPLQLTLQHAITTYKLAPFSTVILQKLTYPQIVNKLPAFYGAGRFIFAFTSARALSLS
jgi:hypothetical protein